LGDESPLGESRAATQVAEVGQTLRLPAFRFLCFSGEGNKRKPRSIVAKDFSEGRVLKNSRREQKIAP
jgi:hypothetical protein